MIDTPFIVINADDYYGKVGFQKIYQYLTQAMVELAHGDYDAVLLTLAPLETFCAAFKRNIDMIENP